LFFSVHLFDHDKKKQKGSDFKYKFYPGTGAEDDVAHNVINVPLAPLWREKEVAKNISSPSNGESNTRRHNTRHKAKQQAAAATAGASTNDSSKGGKERSASSGSGSTLSSDTNSAASDTTHQSQSRPPLPTASSNYPPHYLMGTGRLAYRRAIQHRLLPALRAFNPDLIIMSTGFDAARGDVGNARHYTGGTEAIGLDLEPEDYAWTTRKVCEVADICCHGRVVSVLEGGYGRTPPTLPPPPIVDGKQPPVHLPLDKSLFSECSMQHLKALVDPYDGPTVSSDNTKRK